MVKLLYPSIIAIASFGGLLSCKSTPSAGDTEINHSSRLAVDTFSLPVASITSGDKQPSFGPAILLAGHIALVPLVRIGAYATHDISPIEAQPARRLYAGPKDGPLRFVGNVPDGAMRWVDDGRGGYFTDGDGRRI